MILKCAHCNLQVCASGEADADYPDFCPMPTAADVLAETRAPSGAHRFARLHGTRSYRT